MVIWLASYPRSGNMFCRVLLHQLYGIPTSSLYALIEPRRPYPIGQALGMTHPAEWTLDDLIAADDDWVVKTHELPADDYPAIYLVRDGRDALISHAHFHLHHDLRLPLDEQQMRFTDTLRMLIETDTSFGGWSAHVSAWTSQAQPTAVVKFKDMIRAPRECLRRALTAIGHEPQERSDASIPTFAELRALFPTYFRKGQIGAWREEFPEDLHEAFWRRHGAPMHEMGYFAAAQESVYE